MIKSLPKEYNFGKGTLRYWLKNTHTGCTETKDVATMELERMRKQNVELVKENQFLKKSGTILCQRNRLAQYQFIRKYHEEFSARWLLWKFP